MHAESCWFPCTSDRAVIDPSLSADPRVTSDPGHLNSPPNCARPHHNSLHNKATTGKMTAGCRRGSNSSVTNVPPNVLQPVLQRLRQVLPMAVPHPRRVIPTACQDSKVRPAVANHHTRGREPAPPLPPTLHPRFRTSRDKHERQRSGMADMATNQDPHQRPSS